MALCYIYKSIQKKDLLLEYSILRYDLNTFNPEVQDLQDKLIKAGYPVGIDKADGYFGGNTLIALNNFKDTYLPDGNVGDWWGAVGPTTLEFLDRVIAQKQGVSGYLNAAEDKRAELVAQNNETPEYITQVTSNSGTSISNIATNVTAGAAVSLDNNMYGGLANSIKPINPNQDSLGYKIGKIGGDIGSLIAGGGAIVGGTAGEVGGVALDSTGVGALAGVPINVTSAVAISGGTVVVVRSANNLVNDTINLFTGSSGGSGSPTNWKSVKEYGHTFNTHGSGGKNTKSLTDRARSTGNNQGQWLDNQKTADYLKSLGDIKEPVYLMGLDR